MIGDVVRAEMLQWCGNSTLTDQRIKVCGGRVKSAWRRVTRAQSRVEAGRSQYLMRVNILGLTASLRTAV